MEQWAKERRKRNIALGLALGAHCGPVFSHVHCEMGAAYRPLEGL